MTAELRVRVIPRAGKNEITGERDGALVVRVTAPPEGGRANEATCRTVARALRIAPGRVTVARGGGSRDKLLRVAGIMQGDLERLRRASGSR